MARRSVSAGMTRLEKILGGGLLAIYLFVLPLTADPLFDLIGKLFGITIAEGVRDAAYYYILFALTLIALWRYFGRTTRAFLDRAGGVLAAAGLGLVAFYGLNEISWRVLRMFFSGQINLNDQNILARMDTSPHTTVLIVVILAPVVEEAIFRGYVFGNLREYGRWPAYLASCLLFAWVHVWPFVAAGWDFSYLPLMVQYIVPGLVMAWTFERAGSLWGSVLLHCAVNGLAVWSAM